MRINGNLVFNSDASGELQNVFIERLASAPSFNAAEKGRVYFDTTTALYYFNDGTAWQPFATGGNATLLATYVNNLIASVGPAVNNVTGAWISNYFSSDPILAGATSITNALSLLSSAAYGHELLSELGDVALGALVNGQVLMYNGTSSMWNNHTLVLADVSDVTALAADVNLFTGAAAGTGSYAGSAITATELSYLNGATSNIQSQLDNKQPLNANLTNISSLASTGIVVQTGTATFDERSLVAPSRGFTITNADGVSGNPTFVLANNLAALEGLTGEPGFVVYTADGTATLRDIVTGSSSRIVVTNGDGGAASPTIDLATVTQGSTGSFQKFTVDSYGRVSATTPVVQADITALVDSVYVNVTGDSMSGTLTMTGSATITGVPNPTNASDVANKSYVDAAVAGLTVHPEVMVATTAALAATYANGTAGVGATLTASADGALSIDGQTPAVGERVLVKNQADGTQNGVYVVTNAGSAGSAFVLTRASDADNSTPGSMEPGYFVWVAEGTVNAATGWVQTAVGTGANEAIVIGTDGIVFTQFSGAGTYTAGTGLELTGGVFSVQLGAGIAEVPTGEVGLDLLAPATNALILTTDGTTRSTDAAAQLALLLKSAGGLTQDATGLYIPAAGVSNAMLANSTITLDVDSSGTGSIALGGTLSVFGTSAQGISTSATTVGGQPVITITASDASSSQKGVAKFVSPTFIVTTGSVDIAAAGVTNAMLANSTITVTGTTGSTDIALGNTLSIVGDGTTGITTAMLSGILTLSNALATTGSVGVASFSSTDFSVTAGAVSLVAKSLNSLTNVAVATPVSGQALVYDAATSKFINESFYYLYTGASASSHTVTHNLGQKYCNVTVVDSTDEVVIPQSITFNDNNTLTVTFTSAIACTVVVMGVALK